MVDIQAKEVIDKISEDLKIQPALKLPRAIADKIQLVFNTNPERNILITAGQANDALTGAILVAKVTKKTFLVGWQISTTKDAIATSVSTILRATAKGNNGAARAFAFHRYEPLTAGSFSHTTILPLPIEIEPGSTIQIENSTAIASIDSVGVIYYYETDPQ